MKNICLVAIGTRGDVCPVLALAKLLVGGNKVIVLAPPENKTLFERNDIAFLSLGDKFNQVVQSRDLGYFQNQIGLQFKEHLEIIKNADVVIGAGLFYAGRTLAEYFNTKYYHLFYTPQVLRSDFHAPPGSRTVFGGMFANRLRWIRYRTENNLILKGLINRRRKELGLPRIRNVYDYFIEQPGVLIAVDEELGLFPPGYNGPVRQINYLYSGDYGIMNQALQSFLDKGSRPVVINFGSAEYAVRDLQTLLRSTIESVRALGYRIVVISSMQIKEYLNDGNIFFTEFASHAIFLRHMLAMIHHGGIGTVYSALRSGIPQIIVPQLLDQHFWAEVLDKKGLGKRVRGGTRRYGADLRDAIFQVLTDREMAANILNVKARLNSPEYGEECLQKIRKALPECFD